MSSPTHVRRSIKRLFWIFGLLLALPAVVYAADLVLVSGDFVGLGAADGRLVFAESGDIDTLTLLNGRLVIDFSGPPQDSLHLKDSNLLIESADETSLRIRRNVTYTNSVSDTIRNPTFEFGRILQAGDLDAEVRFLYSDDDTIERSVFEFDGKGIVASVKTDRGSHFEGFISTTDAEPVFRLNSYPQMRLEMGPGGSEPVDVAMQREEAGALTFITQAEQRARIDENGVTVSAGYLKLDTVEGRPPAEDCYAEVIGRMQISVDSPFLYVCTVEGWGKVLVLTNDVYVPKVQAP